MKDGEAGLLRYEDAGAKAGTVTQEQADAAFRLRTEQERLSISLQSFGYQLAGELAPDIIPVVREMSHWVETNKDWLSHDITQSVHDFITYLKNGGWQTIKADIQGIVHETDDVITRFGSWKTAIEVLGAAWALNSPVGKLIFEIGKLSTMTIPGWVGKLLGIVSVAGSAATAGAAAVAAAGAAAGAMNMPVVDDMGRPGPITWGGNPYGADFGTGNGLSQGPGPRGKFVPNLATSEQRRRAQSVYDYYRSQSWSDAAALGAVANLQAESSMNDRADNGSHYGIGHWDANRQAAFRAWSGIDIRSSNFDEQMRFGEWELHNGDPKSVLAGQIMRRARTPGEAARAFSHYNERPGSDADDSARALAADRIGDALQRHDVADDTPSTATSAGADPSGRIRVEVIHQNPPPGASVQVTTPDSPHMDVAPPMTVQSMPGAGVRNVARDGY